MFICIARSYKDKMEKAVWNFQCFTLTVSLYNYQKLSFYGAAETAEWPFACFSF